MTTYDSDTTHGQRRERFHEGVSGSDHNWRCRPSCMRRDADLRVTTAIVLNGGGTSGLRGRTSSPSRRV